MTISVKPKARLQTHFVPDPSMKEELIFSQKPVPTFSIPRPTENFEEFGFEINLACGIPCKVASSEAQRCKACTMATSRISELASLIAVHTAAVDEYFSSSNLPEPSFSPEFPAQVLSEAKIAASRQIILEATDELHSLLLGPVGALTSPSVRIPTSFEPLPNQH